MRTHRLRPWLAGVALALFVACGEGACGGESPVRRPNALLITCDTTVPEALSCYGKTLGTTPNIDALARDGIVFEHARAVAPFTLPSHASMLTGRYPVRHSVRMNGAMRLPERAETLAERARDAGYQTAAFISAVVLDREFGLDQGFEHYDAPAPPPDPRSRVAARRDGALTADLALEWLAKSDPDRPFLVWLHLFDPHAPCDPPAAFRSQGHGEAYLGAVAYMDHQVGRVLDLLRERGAYDETLVILVADHGEGLGRHGEDTHGPLAFDSTLAVPLVVKPSGDAQRGSRDARIASVVDVFPTLLAGLELGAPGDVDGLSLFERPSPDRGVYFETYFGFFSYGWSPLAGWADATGKYVHTSAPEFYDLTSDPLETTNVIAERATLAQVYRAKIEELLLRPIDGPEGLGDAFGGKAEQLQMLGYATSSEELLAKIPSPLAPSQDPSPHLSIREHVDFLAAQLLTEQGATQRAIPMLERIVRGNPKHHNAWFLLGLNLSAQQRFTEAIDAFVKTSETRGEDWPGSWLNIAVCFQNLGKVDAAIENYERGLRDALDPPEAVLQLVDLLERRGAPGDRERARQLREALVRLLETRGAPGDRERVEELRKALAGVEEGSSR